MPKTTKYQDIDTTEIYAKHLYTTLEKFCESPVDCSTWFWCQTKKYNASKEMANNLRHNLIFVGDTDFVGGTRIYSFYHTDFIEKPLTRIELVKHVIIKLQEERRKDIVKAYADCLDYLIKYMSQAADRCMLEHTDKTPAKTTPRKAAHKPTWTTASGLGDAYGALDSLLPSP